MKYRWPKIESSVLRFLHWSLEQEEMDGSFLAPTQKPNIEELGRDEELVFDANAAVDFDDDGGIGGGFLFFLFNIPGANPKTSKFKLWCCTY
jgi:hypothetical protein